MSDLTMTHYEEISGIYDTLVAVYLEVHAGTDDPFFGEARYHRQLTSHSSAPGFDLVAAHDRSGEIAGYAYGFPLPADARWWTGMLTETPPGLLTETGRRTFALCEIMIRPAWRGQGVAHALHDEILAARREERATLLVSPDNPARDICLHWGWEPIGQQRPSWEGAPLYDCMVLPLRPN